MKNIIATSILVAATLSPFAVGSASADSSADALVASHDTKPWFPMLASDAVLPSVAHRQLELSTDRDRYTFSVRVCVAPTGKVAKVDIMKPSGSTDLDRAAAQDIAKWQFEAFSAPQNIRVCKQLSLSYEPDAETSHIAIPLVRMSNP